jgi:adenylate kinase
MKVIIVTGSVGSGKTTLSKKIAKRLGFEYIDVNRLIEKEKISCGYDRKRKCKIIDIKRLNKSIVKLIEDFKKPIKIKTNVKKLKNKKIKKGMVIDSHLSHFLPKRYLDLCIVTKCDLKMLNNRLKRRKYSKEKIKENLECEIFDVCLDEARERKHKVIIINTTKGIKIDEISKKVI